MLTKPDLTYLKEMSGGDKGLMTEIFDIYLEQVPEFIADLKAGLEKGDFNAIYQISHKAKTSVAIVGFNALSAEFKKLEVSAKKSFENERPAESVNALIAWLMETQYEIDGLKKSL
jgi:HPt (histidine-containing phosphotransfer) domain-containing protein